jgi:hypothetical protein
MHTLYFVDLSSPVRLIGVPQDLLTAKNVFLEMMDMFRVVFDKVAMGESPKQGWPWQREDTAQSPFRSDPTGDTNPESKTASSDSVSTLKCSKVDPLRNATPGIKLHAQAHRIQGQIPPDKSPDTNIKVQTPQIQVQAA